MTRIDVFEDETTLRSLAPPIRQALLPRGVPEGRRRAALLSAAETMFLSRGFVATTMSDIARAAGMSKKTIYLVFRSKTELFNALLMDRLGGIAPSTTAVAESPEAALRLILRQLARHLLSPHHIALTRLALASAGPPPRGRGDLPGSLAPDRGAAAILAHPAGHARHLPDR